jgi:glycosyltransferase involved in cell wall biosynthesis
MRHHLSRPISIRMEGLSASHGRHVPRIAHVISVEGNKIGGAARIMFSLLEGGRERAWEQLVLNPYASNERGLADHCDGIPYETLTPHSVSAFPRARRWLHRRLGEFRPQIIHVHLLHAMVTVASLRKSPSAATLLTYHHHLKLQVEGRSWSERIDQLAGRRYDCIVAVGEVGERFLLSEYGYPPSQVTCIRNGWSGAPVLDPRKADVPTVVCVANFRPQKRHDVLLDAFARVRARIPEARLVLAGDGPLLGEVQERARRLGLGESVEFRGPVGEIWPLLADSHVFTLTSDYEGIPVALIEAMAAGLPAVASSVEGNTDLVQAGETGFLFAPGDASACAERFLTLLSDSGLRRRMGDAAREAAQDWTMERCVDRYFELYEELIRRKARAGAGG